MKKNFAEFRFAEQKVIPFPHLEAVAGGGGHDALLHASSIALYSKRLLDDGWVRRVDDPLPKETKRQRKAYALTEQGRRVLRAEIVRLRRLVNVAQTQTAEETL